MESGRQKKRETVGVIVRVQRNAERRGPQCAGPETDLHKIFLVAQLRNAQVEKRRTKRVRWRAILGRENGDESQSFANDRGGSIRYKNWKKINKSVKKGSKIL